MSEPVPAPDLVRRAGKRTEDGVLRGKLASAVRAKDQKAERDAALSLSRWLFSREEELELAVSLTRRALEIEDDQAVRAELAQWLENLGMHTEASDEILKSAEASDDPQRARGLFIRAGIDKSRAGDARAAVAAFEKASATDPTHPLPHELAGSIAMWAPEGMPPARAAQSFVAASRLRISNDAKIDDLVRAFETDPTSEAGANGLVDLFVSQESPMVADEVLRLRVGALERAGRTDEARLVHEARKKLIATSSDVSAWLALALDREADGTFTGREADEFDDLLGRSGLLEALAVRLEIRAEREVGKEKVRLLSDLARLLSGPLASTDRSARVWAMVLEADPTHREALLFLKSHAISNRSPALLADALIRAAVHEQGATCARELAVLAEERGDPTLAAWSYAQILRSDPADARARTGLVRVQESARAEREELEKRVARLAVLRGADRVPVLRDLAAMLSMMPEDAGRYRSVLVEVVYADPADESMYVTAERVVSREGDYGELIRIANARSTVAVEMAQKIELVRTIARAARSRGELDVALATVQSVHDESGENERAAALLWGHAALAKDAALRGRALSVIASSASSAQVSGIMFAVSAGLLRRSGDDIGARFFAERAHEVSPTSPRCATVFAETRRAGDGKEAELAIERAMATSFPRSEWCAEVATLLSDGDEPERAIGYLQKRVALRPGDVDALQALVTNALRTTDSARAADVLTWTLTKPLPVSSLGTLIAAGLGEIASVDLVRAASVARRALDVLGPVNLPLRTTVLDIADRASDFPLALRALERTLVNAPSEERGPLLVKLAARAKDAGEFDTAARALSRAARLGADVATAAAQIEPTKLGEAGELAWLELQPHLRMLSGDAAGAAGVWREYGGALWDVADDHGGSIEAFGKAVAAWPQILPAIAVDLARLGGLDFAVDALFEIAESDPDRERSALTATEAARAAIGAGQFERAMTIARYALLKSRSSAAALDVAEVAAARASSLTDLSLLYGDVAARALGKFGRRAAHYRGARFFETRGEVALALKHATDAFIAVPSEGAIFQLLSRLANRSGGRSDAVKAIETVADRSSPEQRAGWLVRAAQIAGRDLEGARQRVDLLLRASILSTLASTVALLGEAIGELIERAPTEKEDVALRMQRAAEEVAKKIDGPDGARAAIAFAVVSLQRFDDPKAAWAAIERALVIDAGLPEFRSLFPFVKRLAEEPEARRKVEDLLLTAEKKFSNVGVAALRFAAALAESYGDRPVSRLAMVIAAEKEPLDETLTADAQSALSDADDPSLSGRLNAVRKTRIEEQKRKEEESWGDLDSDEPPTEKGIHSIPDSQNKSDLPGSELLEHKTDPGQAILPVSVAPRLPDTVDAAREEAHAHTLSGNEAAAEIAWRRVLDKDPFDEEADYALEALLGGRSAYAEVVEHLGRRINRLKQGSSSAEGVRAIRLRRAAILEQRLDKLDAARRELEELLKETPDHQGALSYLADLHMRLGEAAKALPPLLRVRGLRENPYEFDEIDLRIAHAEMACNQLAAAKKTILGVLERSPDNLEARELHVELLKKEGASEQLVDALMALANVSPDGMKVRAETLLETSRASARSGRPMEALEWAREAARLQWSAEAELQIRMIEYELRGSGSPDDARRTIESLAKLDGELDEQNEARRLFLWAEALDSVHGGGAGMELLLDRYGAGARQALIAIGIAERLVTNSRFKEAMLRFEEGLAGDLLGLRRKGQVALAALDAARRAGDADASLVFLDEALKHDDSRALALSRVPKVVAELKNSVEIRGILRSHTVSHEGDPKAEILAALAGLLEASGRPNELEDAEQCFTEAVSIASPALASAIDVSRSRLRMSRASKTPEPPRVDSKPPAPAFGIASLKPPPLSTRDPEVPSSSSDRAEAAIARGLEHLASGRNQDAERELLHALSEGAIRAADILGGLWAERPERAGALVKVRRQAAELEPGNRLRLSALLDAARADHNQNYARALEHLLHAFEGRPEYLPPPLSAQNAQPGMLQLLLRHSREASGETLGLVWEGAFPVFLRNLPHEDPNLMHRVVPGPASSIGKVLDLSMKLLGLPKIPVFVKVVPDGDRGFGVSLRSPVAALLTGQRFEDSSETRWLLGKALAAALPSNALLFGLPEGGARRVWSAIVAGFGPPNNETEIDQAGEALVETLQQTIPARIQRRIKELLEQDSSTDFDLVMDRALQSGRRLGHFLTGDFAHSARSLIREYPDVDTSFLDAQGGLEWMCSTLPSLSDLYRLAIRPEFADARFSSTRASRGAGEGGQ